MTRVRGRFSGKIAARDETRFRARRETLMLPKRNWMEMTWQEIAAGETARWIAVLPLAAVEQHGPHLPLGVDTFIAEAYLERVGKMLPADLPVTFLPVQRDRRLRRASVIPRHADAFGDDRDRGLDRARREPGARGRAQARSDHEPRRQCRGDGSGGARIAHAARHACRHRRLASLRLSGRHVRAGGKEARHSRRRYRDLADARGQARHRAHGQGAQCGAGDDRNGHRNSNGSAPIGRRASLG